MTTTATMTLQDLHALGDRLAAEWMPSEQERAEAVDPIAFREIGDRVHQRRQDAVREILALTTAEAAYVVGRMTCMRGYSQLGQYLAIEMYGPDAAKPIDPGAALRFLDIR